MGRQVATVEGLTSSKLLGWLNPGRSVEQAVGSPLAAGQYITYTPYLILFKDQGPYPVVARLQIIQAFC